MPVQQAQATLSATDMESVYEAVKTLVLGFSDFPSWFTANNGTVKWNFATSGTCIGLYPLQGAHYLKKYVSGSYVALFPFSILFKTNANTTNTATEEVFETMDALSKYMEACAVDFTDPHVRLDKIERTSPVYMQGQTDKELIIAVSMRLKYTFTK